MKIRTSFVSNSSSSSFLFLYNDISDFDSLTNIIDEEGRVANKILAEDIERFGDKWVKEFLTVDCARAIHKYYCYNFSKVNRRANGIENEETIEEYYSDYKDIQKFFENFCKDVNLDFGSIKKLVDKWKNKIDTMPLKVPNEDYIDEEAVHNDAVVMANMAFETLKHGEWKHAFAITYHEEDDIGWGMDRFLCKNQGYRNGRPYVSEAKFTIRMLDNR